MIGMHFGTSEHPWTPLPIRLQGGPWGWGGPIAGNLERKCRRRTQHLRIMAPRLMPATLNVCP
eukprot:450775-Hanusia_phi.AAC.1